jgi:c-di-GMP-binding flagellar brake protein YcgR
MEERRKIIRISASMTISYRVMRGFILSSSRSKDISAGGICLPTWHRFEPGVALELKIYLTEFSKPIEAIGEVVWLNEKNDIRFPYLLGIKFVKIDEADRDKIKDHIKKSIEVKTKGVKWMNK